MNIIQLCSLTKQYSEKTVLRDANLDIATGSFVALRGESGAGKSTLLNLIGGLETPTSGRIIVDGKDVGSLSAKERTDFYRHEIGIIFQGSYLQPQFSLFENIALPGIFAGLPEAERQSKVKQLAQMLGISDNLNSLPRAVSGGQAERACIARALLLDPKIILADEPTSNLDEVNAKTVLKILDDLRERLGITVVVASHSRDILEFATQTVTIEDGRVMSEIVTNQKATDDRQGTI